MFKWLKKILQNYRIEAEFPAYDKLIRNKHLVLAEERFSVKNLEAEVNLLMQPIHTESSSRFSKSIIKQHTLISGLNSSLFSQRSKLKFFQPDYKQEIEQKYAARTALFTEKDSVYQNKNQLHADLKEAYEEKNEAYDKLAEIQSDIDDWYSKSERTPLLFGNGGRNIPNRSFFFQSMGDLENDKEDRDDAYDDIQDCKETIYALKKDLSGCNSRINGIKTQLCKLKQEIQKLKQERQHMYDLKKKGYNRFNLEKGVKRDEGLLQQKHTKLKAFETQQSVFIQSAKQQAGVIKLEKKICDIGSAKKKFNTEFDSENTRKLRKQAHRKAWLIQNG